VVRAKDKAVKKREAKHGAGQTFEDEIVVKKDEHDKKQKLKCGSGKMADDEITVEENKLVNKEDLMHEAGEVTRDDMVITEDECLITELPDHNTKGWEKVGKIQHCKKNDDTLKMAKGNGLV